MDLPLDEFKSNSDVLIGDILILNDPLEPNNKSNCLGDAELESLKKEEEDFDMKEQNNRMPKEIISSPEIKGKEDLEANVDIENYEMVSSDSDCSSGVGSTSNSSNESVFGTISASKAGQVEHRKFGEFLRPMSVDVETEGITTVCSLESENLKTLNNSESTGITTPESDRKEVPLKGKASEKLSLKVLAEKPNEAPLESTCIEAVSKSKDVGDNPLIKIERSVDGAEEILRFTPKLPYRNTANPFEIVVPFVGKKPDWGEIKPFPCDLARRINRMKFEENDCYVPEMSYHEMMKKRQARSKEEVERDDQQELLITASVAAYVAKKILIRILLQMQKEKPDEEALIRYFERFLDAPVSPVAMLYIPQFVHTVMYIRGSSNFSYKVRKMAERCYYRVHVMFPIPEGYNFETVYTSEVKKFLPEGVDGLHDYAMEYDEMESSDESEDSAFSDNSESND